MYHIFLIHSLVEGHLGCFQVLAMTNKAAMNIDEHMSCGTVQHPLDIYPKVVLLSLSKKTFKFLLLQKLGFYKISFLFVCFFVLFCFSRQGFSVILEPVLELALIDQGGLKLTEICLPLPPECWD